MRRVWIHDVITSKVIDTTLVNKYGIFILEVVGAWIDRSQKHPRTIHDQGKGVFAVDGEIIKLRARSVVRLPLLFFLLIQRRKVCSPPICP